MKPLPDLGDVATDYAWLTWTEWRRIYGPINYLNAAGQSILIANSQEVATSLLDERSAIYSDRPRFVMAAEVSGKPNVLFSCHSPTVPLRCKVMAT